MSDGVYTLAVKGSFAAAHRLRGYGGDCENLHGHNWAVEVVVESEALDGRGIAVDFRAMKSALSGILDGLDHRCINDVPPFDVINPSSENIARYVFEKMEELVQAPARIARAVVWESEDARAEYARRG